MLRAEELELLSRYAAEELPFDEAAHVEGELSRRPELRLALAKLEALDSAVADFRQRHLVSSVDVLLAESYQPPRPRRWPWLLSGLVALVALGLAFAALSSDDEPAVSSPSPSTPAFEARPAPSVVEVDPVRVINAHAQPVSVPLPGGLLKVLPGSRARVQGEVIDLEEGTLFVAGNARVRAGREELQIEQRAVVTRSREHLAAQRPHLKPEQSAILSPIDYWQAGERGFSRLLTDEPAPPNAAPPGPAAGSAPEERVVMQPVMVPDIPLPAPPPVFRRLEQGEASFHGDGPAGFKIVGKTDEVWFGTVQGKTTLRVILATVDTGIELRNRHMKERYLDAIRHPYVDLVFEGEKLARGKGRRGEARFWVRGRSHPVTVIYDAREERGAVLVTGSFHINLTDYGIEAPSYMGMTVKPRIEVRASFTLPR